MRLSYPTTMIDIQEFLWVFSIISFLLYFIRSLRKTISMAVSLTSPPTPPPSSSSSPSLLDWFFFEPPAGTSSINVSDNPIVPFESSKRQALGSKDNEQDDLARLPEGRRVLKFAGSEYSSSPAVELSGGEEGSCRLRKRPSRLIVPEYPAMEFGEINKKIEEEEFEVEGRDYYLASKKGRREVMEDGYGVLLDIHGDPKQAFFAVMDGHGGRAAAEYVAENLGKNIVKAVEFMSMGTEEEKQIEAAAINRGYLATDKEFLSQGVNGGACVASVLIRNGHIHVANVGDCRVVLSRNGAADVLTTDHRLAREDERLRIETSGGFVHCRNGVWRVNGSLAVSRAIGDLHLKEWVISEPHIKKLPLTADCQFLIMASDGLWDKVNDQEAIDVVLRGKNSAESCKELVDMSSRRGSLDDITVMVINVQKFLG